MLIMIFIAIVNLYLACVQAEPAFNPSAWTSAGSYELSLSLEDVLMPDTNSGFTIEFWLYKKWSSEVTGTLLKAASGVLIEQVGGPSTDLTSELTFEGLGSFQLANLTWHHIAMTRAPSALTTSVYANATLQTTYEGAHVDFSALILGDSQVNVKSLWRELRIWRTCRSQAQIEGLHYNVKVSYSDELAVLYHLTEGIGRIIYDTENILEVHLPTDQVWYDVLFIAICQNNQTYKDGGCTDCPANCIECNATGCLRCQVGFTTLPIDFDGSGTVKCEHSRKYFKKELGVVIESPIDSSQFTNNAYTAEMWLYPPTSGYATFTDCKIQLNVFRSYFRLAASSNFIVAKEFYPRWYHFSLNYATNVQVVYLNGALVATKSESWTVIPTCLLISNFFCSELKLYNYKKNDGSSKTYDNYFKSELGSTTLPKYYWPLLEAGAPYKARGSYGSDYSGVSDDGAFLSASPTVCYGSQTLFETGFGGESICIDEVASKALRLSAQALNLVASYRSCADLEAAASAIEFWYKADTDSIADATVLADFGNLKFKKASGLFKYSLGSVELNAGGPYTANTWKHNYVSFQKAVVLRSLDYTEGTCAQEVALTSSDPDPCPSKFQFSVQPGAFVRFVRWWEREIQSSAVLCSGALPFTSFVGLNLSILRMDYPLNEADVSVVVDASIHGNTTTVSSTQSWAAQDTSTFIQKRRLGYVCRDSSCNESTDNLGGVLASPSAYFLCSVASSQPTSSTSCENRSSTTYLRLPSLTYPISFEGYITSELDGAYLASFELEVAFLILVKTTACTIIQLGSAVTVSTEIKYGALYLKFDTTLIPIKERFWYSLRYVSYEALKVSRLYLNGVELTIPNSQFSFSSSTTVNFGTSCNCLYSDLKIVNNLDPLHERRSVLWDQTYADIMSYAPNFNYSSVYDTFDQTQSSVSNSGSSDSTNLARNDVIALKSMLKEALAHSPTLSEASRYTSCAAGQYRKYAAGSYSCVDCSTSNCKACSKTQCGVCTSSYYLSLTSNTEATCELTCPSSTTTAETPQQFCKRTDCVFPCTYCYGNKKDECLAYSESRITYDFYGHLASLYPFNVFNATGTSISLSQAVPYTIQALFTSNLGYTNSSSSVLSPAFLINSLEVKVLKDKLFLYNGASLLLSCEPGANLKGVLLSISATASAFQGFIADPSSDTVTQCTANDAYVPSPLTSIGLGSDANVSLEDNFIASLRVLDREVTVDKDPLNSFYFSVTYRPSSSAVVREYPLSEGPGGASVRDSKA
jgi:hypothetical protein